ncbi:MAG: DUF1492 domain-containing protein [Oscillospiraceae bacterium]|nr:DUF1492 domain-containing protein [Oscillospiraceae bacterium]
MTIRDYLFQAYRLDQRIDSNIREVSTLRKMMGSISSPVLGDRVQTSRPAEAPFVRSLEKIMALEEKINSEIDLLISLKEQIRGVIAAVPDTDERMVLSYRYVHNLTWEEISDELNESVSTVKRRHRSALDHAVLPENFIQIEN